MFESAPRRLAVAALSEAGDAAALFRGPDGRPLQGYVLITGDGPDCRITVYLERGAGTPAAVLAGEMVWFQAQPEPDPEPDPGPAPAPPAAAEPVALPPGREPEREPEPAAEVEDGSETAPGFKLYPEPAVPVATTVPAHMIQVQVTPVQPEPESPAPAAAPPEVEAVALASRHPLAPRAGGTARIDPAAGRLALTIRGLPSPATIGAGLGAYRAWLLNQRTGARHPLGMLARAWGDNYRLESEADLPICRFDAVLITADDRITAIPDAPQVLLGVYAPR